MQQQSRSTQPRSQAHKQRTAAHKQRTNNTYNHSRAAVTQPRTRVRHRHLGDRRAVQHGPPPAALLRVSVGDVVQHEALAAVEGQPQVPALPADAPAGDGEGGALCVRSRGKVVQGVCRGQRGKEDGLPASKHTYSAAPPRAQQHTAARGV